MVFQAKDGVAQWRKIYDRLVTMKPGDRISNETLVEITGTVNFRSALPRAVKEFEEAHKRTLVSVRGEGYRVAEAHEHVREDKKRLDRARTQVKKGHHTVVHTDLNALTAEQIEQQRRLEARMSSLESLMRSQESKTKSMSDMLQEGLLKERREKESLAKTVEQQQKMIERLTTQESQTA